MTEPRIWRICLAVWVDFSFLCIWVTLSTFRDNKRLKGTSNLTPKGLSNLFPGTFKFLLYLINPNAAAAAKSLQSCPTLCDPRDGRPPRPWDSPGKNTGVGCHFLLQCMKVKSESEVAQLCPTLCDPMDCSLPGSSIHGSFQARVLEWVAIAFSDKS